MFLSHQALDRDAPTIVAEQVVQGSQECRFAVGTGAHQNEHALLGHGALKGVAHGATNELDDFLVSVENLTKEICPHWASGRRINGYAQAFGHDTVWALDIG